MLTGTCTTIVTYLCTHKQPNRLDLRAGDEEEEDEEDDEDEEVVVLELSGITEGLLIITEVLIMVVAGFDTVMLMYRLEDKLGVDARLVELLAAGEVGIMLGILSPMVVGSTPCVESDAHSQAARTAKRTKTTFISVTVVWNTSGTGQNSFRYKNRVQTERKSC